MTRVESYVDSTQCFTNESRQTQGPGTAIESFKRAAAQRIRSFLLAHDLPAEEAYGIYFNIEDGSGELVVETSGSIPADLLEKLQAELLSLATRRGVCEVAYFPPSPPEENEDEEEGIESQRPRVAQRNVELHLGEATLEVQTPPAPPPDDEASHASAGATKEPREANTVMTFPEDYSEMQVTLADGRILTIHVAPGVKILSSDQ
ncbi:hypothetical protein HZC35_02785 [Candidatus Saganbacteria bacterium]|nr:hypothetical protein [Candidatus Saganbacteria bacterium]